MKGNGGEGPPEERGGRVEIPDFGIEDELAPVMRRLRRDLRAAAEGLGPMEARYLVDSYYAIQDFRMQSGHQVGALDANGEPHLLIDWSAEAMRSLEDSIKAALDAWGKGQPMARWARQIVGIGPVIAAGLVAHIDVRREPTVGHLWRFAGLDPTRQTMAKGEKRGWNAKLKVLCWKAGQSFMKKQNHPKDIYGKIYVARKRLEQERNDTGAYAEQAAAYLAAKRWGKDTESYKAYSAGRLPKGQIDARARRYQ